MTNWAKQHKIILFVLPAHTSHVLQPLDLGCFGPFQKIYNNECHKFIRQKPATVITKHNVAEIACRAYSKALSASILTASFKRSGIYPFDPSAVDSLQFAPAMPFKDTLVNKLDDQTNKEQQDANHVSDSTMIADFFEKKNEPMRSKIEHSVSKSRRNLTDVISGKPITDTETAEKKIEKYKSNAQTSVGKKRKISENKTEKIAKSKKSCSVSRKIDTCNKGPKSPQPGLRQHIMYPVKIIIVKMIFLRKVNAVGAICLNQMN